MCSAMGAGQGGGTGGGWRGVVVSVCVCVSRLDWRAMAMSRPSCSSCLRGSEATRRHAGPPSGQDRGHRHGRPSRQPVPEAWLIDLIIDTGSVGRLHQHSPQ
ncbi:MAG: hypothetical protein ACK56I_11825, partial [bacterium]